MLHNLLRNFCIVGVTYMEGLIESGKNTDCKR